MRLLCLGDNNVDIYRGQGRIYPGGNCVNVAVYASRNGVEAAYLGNLGRDYPGRVQQRAMETNGVDVSRIRWWDEPTSAADVEIVDGDRVFSNYTNEIHTVHPITLTDQELQECAGFDWIHTSCYSILSADTLPRLKAMGVPVSYDFSIEFTEQEIAALCPYITVAFFSCGHMSHEGLHNVLRKAYANGCRLAVATRGAEGAVLFDGTKFRVQPAYSVEPVDTMGAGDSFIARFIQCYGDAMLRLTNCISKLESLGQKPLELPQYEELVIDYSLSQAALFSANNCLSSGAFGNDKPLNEI